MLKNYGKGTSVNSRSISNKPFTLNELCDLCEETNKQIRAKAWKTVASRVRGQNLRVTYLGVTKEGKVRFKCTSGTTAGKYWYQEVMFKDLNVGLQLLRENPTVTQKSVISLILSGDLLLHCNDPSYKYYFQYVATKGGYAIKPEKRYPKKRNPQLTGSVCFTGDTPILTSHGFKFIKDVKIGDEVYSHNGRLCKVTDVSCVDKEVKEVKIGTERFRVSSEHPFLISKGSGKGVKSKYKSYQPHWERVENIKGESYALTPLLKNESSIEVDKSLAFLLGLALSDGHVRMRDLSNSTSRERQYPVVYGKSCNGLHVAYNKDYEEQYRDRFKLLGIPISSEYCYSGTRSATFSIVGPDIMRFICHYMKPTYKEHDKWLNPEVLKWNRDAKRALLMGFFWGDGTVVKNNKSPYVTLFNTNKQVMDILHLIAREFFYPRYNFYDRNPFKAKDGHEIICKRMYYIRLTGSDARRFLSWDKRAILIKGIKEKDIKFSDRKLSVVSGYKRTGMKVFNTHDIEPVYNISVEGDSSYLIGRGCYAVHNCKHLLAVLSVLPMYTNTIVRDFRKVGILDADWEKKRKKAISYTKR